MSRIHTFILLFACHAFGYCVRADEPQSAAPHEDMQAPVIVAYLPDYRLGTIDADVIWLEPVTDLIYFSLAVPEDGVFGADPFNPEHLLKLKALQRRHGCRLLLCIGGWGRSDGFAPVAADPAQRTAMIESLRKLCLTHGFDGIDYDWEHPKDDEQIRHYALLLEQTAADFDKHNLFVTVAQAGWQDLTQRAYDCVDRVHLMSYDHAFPHATLEQSVKDVERLVEWGCPPGKIALGIPFYGRNLNGETRSYAAISHHAGLAPSDDQHAGYAFNGPVTVGLKAQYALEHRLAGVMIWELTQDHPHNHTLLRAISNQLTAKATGSE